MKFFVDTAMIEEIKEAKSWGILDGVTTNPSLIKKAVQKKENINMENYIKQICQVVDGPVSLEVVGLTCQDMVKQAERLYEKFNHVNDNVVVKIPINTRSEENPKGNYEGLKALSRLSEMEIPTNTTLIMKPEQALMAAKAGTEYVSPFAGRVDDYIRKKVGLDRGKDYPKSAYLDDRWMSQASYLHLKPHYEELKGKDLGEIYANKCVNEAKRKVKDEGISSGTATVSSIKRILQNYGFETKVLAASLRNSRQLREVAEAGADVATIPFKVMEGMIGHCKTEEGIENFSRDVVPEYAGIFESN